MYLPNTQNRAHGHQDNQPALIPGQAPLLPGIRPSGQEQPPFHSSLVQGDARTSEEGGPVRIQISTTESETESPFGRMRKMRNSGSTSSLPWGRGWGGWGSRQLQASNRRGPTAPKHLVPIIPEAQRTAAPPGCLPSLHTDLQKPPNIYKLACAHPRFHRSQPKD